MLGGGILVQGVCGIARTLGGLNAVPTCVRQCVVKADVVTSAFEVTVAFRLEDIEGSDTVALACRSDMPAKLAVLVIEVVQALQRIQLVRAVRFPKAAAGRIGRVKNRPMMWKMAIAR